MKVIASQLFKLFIVTKFIFKQYLKIFFSYGEVRLFFTKLYIQSRETEYSFNLYELNRYPLEQIFPGSNLVSINVYAQSKSLMDNTYSPNTNYLISPQEIYILCTLVKFLKPKTVFEFGTYKGWTLANLHSNLAPSTQVYSLDLNRLPPTDPYIESHLNAPNVHLLTGNSCAFDFKEFENKMDFIFIDGGHDYETVKNDTQHAFNMISENGVIVWHDYNDVHPGVYKYLNELKQSKKILGIGSTAIAIYSNRLK